MNRRCYVFFLPFKFLDYCTSIRYFQALLMDKEKRRYDVFVLLY